MYVYTYIVEKRMQKREEKESNYFFNTTALAGLVWGRGGQNIEYRMVSRAYIGGGGEGTTRSIIRVVVVQV